jgi:hypothetical protein
LIFIYGVVVFFPKKKTETIPDQIWGKWTTKAPQYQDRFFELSEISVIFGIGDNKINVYFIKGIKAETKDDGIVFTIIGHNLDRVEHKLTFYYHRGRTAEIRLKNPDTVVWTREKAKPE